MRLDPRLTALAAMIAAWMAVAPSAGAQTAQTAQAAQTAQTAEAAVDRAVAAWGKITSASGTIEQTVTNTLIGSSATSNARFHQQRPNRLSVRFTDLKGDAIVSDGTWLWIYLPASVPGQVIKRPANDASAGGFPIDPGQFLDSPKTRYDIVDRGAATISGRATRAVQLTPKRPADSWFTRATVWIDDADGIVRQFEVVESSSITRRVRFTTFQANGGVPAGTFRFEVPSGVRVVEQR